MSTPDFNLLITLEALLSEGSVVGAARRLGLSQSAMSRALARLRQTTGDPLLVRAGRGLVPTPRALELRERLRPLVDEVTAVLSPQHDLDVSQLNRTFTLRTGEGFVETFGAALLAQVQSLAPGIKLKFVPKPDKRSGPLREALIDLETGVISPEMSPEVRTLGLYRDHFIGVVRKGHKLSDEFLDASDYANADHVTIARAGLAKGPVDEALKHLGLKRNILVQVSGFSSAIALARSTDLIATVPALSTEGMREGLACFALPFKARK